MAAQQQHGGRFAAMLLSLGVVSEEDLVSCFHEEYRLPVIDLSTAEPTPEALRLVPRDLAIHHEALPIGVAGSTLTLAISDPSNLDGLNEVKFRSGCTLRISVAPVRALREAIDQFYGAHVRAAG
jgi:type IV pilus assembly protein PilB